MFCGCCEPSTVPVPPGCTVCDLLWSGYPADVTATTDDFADVDPGWRLLSTFSADGGTGHPINPIDANAPNAIGDYIRSGRMHFFRSPFIVWFDNRLFSTRAMPPAPLPNTALGRQPWLSAIRRANLYFPIVQPRKYRFEITVNYPIDTLPRLADIDHRPAIGAVGVFAIGSANFYIFASGLQYFTDNHTGPTLTVGCQLTNPPPAFPFFNYTFLQTTTVPFGQVQLRLEATWNPQTSSGSTTYFVNNAAILTRTTIPFGAGTGQINPDCASFCGEIIHLAAYEPWRWASSPPRSANPQWEWNGFNWLRGGGNAANPGRAAELTPTWSAANNPDGKLWFDNYSFDFVAP